MAAYSPRSCASALAACTAILVIVPLPADASGARRGDRQQHGEVVVLRDVSARQAIRRMPPGMAVIMDPRPTREINDALGLGELSEDEYAGMAAGTVAVRPPTTVEQVAGKALEGSLGGMVRGDGVLSGDGMVRTIGVPVGIVGGATRGIGDQVRGALSQLPIPSQAAGSPPPGG